MTALAQDYASPAEIAQMHLPGVAKTPHVIIAAAIRSGLIEEGFYNIFWRWAAKMPTYIELNVQAVGDKFAPRLTDEIVRRNCQRLRISARHNAAMVAYIDDLIAKLDGARQ